MLPIINDDRGTLQRRELELLSQTFCPGSVIARTISVTTGNLIAMTAACSICLGCRNTCHVVLDALFMSSRIPVLSRVMRKYNSVTYEVGSAKAEQAAGMFGLTADQRAVSCPSRVAKPLAKPLTGGWRSASYAGSQSSAPCFSRSICSSDFMLM